jgi:hypothetical protein
MKTLIHTLRTLDPTLLLVLMLMGLILAALFVAALTSDSSMARAATEVAGRPWPMGYGWGG